MISTSHALGLIAVMTLGTMLLRFLPFVLFPKGTPKIVLYLGDVLPYAVMGMLVVYCLKGIDFLDGTHGIPEVISGHVNYITTDKKGDAPFCFEASPFCVLFKIVFF